jgi:hypothetical protein
MNDQNNTNAKVIGLVMAGIAAVAMLYLLSLQDKPQKEEKET